MIRYVAGFLFSECRSRVLLIRKVKPEWQAGLLNAVGGKIEPGESPAEAMTREGEEETGLKLEWEPTIKLSNYGGKGWEVHFFRVFADLKGVTLHGTIVEGEGILEMHSTAAYPASEVLPNLRWLLPLHVGDCTFEKGDVITSPHAPKLVARTPVT